MSVLITPIGHIKPITMLDRGDILGIAGKSFVSGKLNIQVCDIGVWVCDIAKDLKSWLPTQIYGIPVKKPQITNL